MKKRFSPTHHIQFISPWDGDGMTETEGAEAVFHSCLAEMWTGGVSETVENMRETAKAVYRVKIRYFPGITYDMQIRDVSRDVLLEIKGSPKGDLKKDFLLFVAEEKTA